MSKVSRRQVVWFGTTAGALTFLQGCDTLVLPVDSANQSEPPEFEPISDNSQFYVYQYGTIPSDDLFDNWELVISDQGEELAVIDRDFLASLPITEFEHTLQCIGSGPRNRLIDNAIWGGMHLSDVLDQMGVSWRAANFEMRFETVDGYHTSIPIADLEIPVWLVWEMNGHPLPVAHGGPVRLIVPTRYGMKNPKWLTRIDFISEEYVGHWEGRGWDAQSYYKTNGFIMWPNEGATLPMASTLMVGTAYAGADPVVRVEITFDDGQSWDDCTLDYAPGQNRWTLWSYAWEPSDAGQHTARIRVTTESGDMSSDDPYGTDRLAGYDGGMQIAITVA